MTGSTLRSAGRLLFGLAWRAPFSAKFHVGDASLRRMCKDERFIPEGLWRDIETALRDRANEIDHLLEVIVA